ncbi:hypothetical protein X566_00965 [Afipia sp. P52-10]|nr:hypothetical protein X566_00965 [Afipia sp. P52-10]
MSSHPAAAAGRAQHAVFADSFKRRSLRQTDQE